MSERISKGLPEKKPDLAQLLCGDRVLPDDPEQVCFDPEIVDLVNPSLCQIRSGPVLVPALQCRRGKAFLLALLGPESMDILQCTGLDIMVIKFVIKIQIFPIKRVYSKYLSIIE